MTRIYLLLATFSVTSSVVSSSASCSNVASATYFNKYYEIIQGPEVFDVVTLHECTKKCRSLARCKAFLYSRNYEQCIIYYFNSATYNPDLRTIVDMTAAVTYDRSAWHMGPCTQNTCTADERCHPTGATYVCRKAVDVCFKKRPIDLCFRRYPSVLMWTFDSLDVTNVDSLQECVSFCFKHYAAECKGFSYDRVLGDCGCNAMSAAEFEQKPESKWFFDEDLATYDKIN